MRLIDADALKDKCYITINGTTIGRNNYVMFHEIDDAPTIDAVQVVRCKDCKWNIDDYMGTWCSRLSGAHGTSTDDFCSYGERKGGEDE